MLSYYLSVLETEQERKRMSDIYEEFQLAFLHAANGILRDTGLAEDAVHNAFINLIKNKELLALPNEELMALLLTIVKRRAVDLARQRKRNKTENLDDISAAPTPKEPVEVQVLTSEDFDKMTECVSRLDEPHRVILRIKYYFELSNTEIGQRLGLTNRQVALQVYDAKLKLRKLYSEEIDIDAR